MKQSSIPKSKMLFSVDFSTHYFSLNEILNEEVAPQEKSELSKELPKMTTGQSYNYCNSISAVNEGSCNQNFIQIRRVQ